MTMGCKGASCRERGRRLVWLSSSAGVAAVLTPLWCLPLPLSEYSALSDCCICRRSSHNGSAGRGHRGAAGVVASFYAFFQSLSQKNFRCFSSTYAAQWHRAFPLRTHVLFRPYLVKQARLSGYILGGQPTSLQVWRPFCSAGYPI